MFCMFGNRIHIEQLCMKTFVVVADAEEQRGRIYGKGTLTKTALWFNISRSRIWTTVCEIIMAHETKTYVGPIVRYANLARKCNF